MDKRVSKFFKKRLYRSAVKRLENDINPVVDVITDDDSNGFAVGKVPG